MTTEKTTTITVIQRESIPRMWIIFWSGTLCTFWEVRKESSFLFSFFRDVTYCSVRHIELSGSDGLSVSSALERYPECFFWQVLLGNSFGCNIYTTDGKCRVTGTLQDGRLVEALFSFLDHWDFWDPWSLAQDVGTRDIGAQVALCLERIKVGDLDFTASSSFWSSLYPRSIYRTWFNSASCIKRESLCSRNLLTCLEKIRCLFSQ